MKKITFIGDITSDRPLLNAAYDRNTDAYDFSPVFGKVKVSSINSIYPLVSDSRTL